MTEEEEERLREEEDTRQWLAERRASAYENTPVEGNYGPAPEEKNTSFLGDSVDLVHAGVSQGFSDLFGGFGLDSIGDPLQESADAQMATVSQSTLDAMSNLGYEGEHEWTAAGLAGVFLQSGGQALTLLVPGTLAAKGVAFTAKAVTGLSKIEKAITVAKSKNMLGEVKKLEKVLAKSTKEIDTLSTRAGYGLVQGSQQYEQGADEAEQRINDADDQQLYNSDTYIQTLYNAELEKGTEKAEAWKNAM